VTRCGSDGATHIWHWKASERAPIFIFLYGVPKPLLGPINLIAWIPAKAPPIYYMYMAKGLYITDTLVHCIYLYMIYYFYIGFSQRFYFSLNLGSIYYFLHAINMLLASWISQQLNGM
jgi:hypothetical protein